MEISRRVISASVPLTYERQRCHLRSDGDAGSNSHKAVDHDGLVTFQALPDHPVSINPRTEPDRHDTDVVVLPDDIDDATILVAADGVIRQQNAPVGIGAAE